MTGLTASLCGGLDHIYWGTPYGDVYVANQDGSGLAMKLYDNIRTEHYTEIGKILDVAVNEESGDLLLGSETGLYHDTLDGSSTYAAQLDTGSVSAVEIDPKSGFGYFGGINNEDDPNGFIKRIRTPFGSEMARVMYTSPIDNRKGHPRDITIDSDAGYMYIVDNHKITRAVLDGTAPVEDVYVGFNFNRQFARTIDIFINRLFIGSFERSSNSSIWVANADGSGVPKILYNLTDERGYQTGIKGLVVRKCVAPSPSPTACEANRSEVTAVFPRSITSEFPRGFMTQHFMFNVGWPRTKTAAIFITIEANRGKVSNPLWRSVENALSVNVDSGVDGSYVYLYDFNLHGSGTYRWLVSVSVVDDACVEEDTTEWEVYSLETAL